jgi:hypothetical protein
MYMVRVSMWWWYPYRGGIHGGGIHIVVVSTVVVSIWWWYPRWWWYPYRGGIHGGGGIHMVY